jgi:hypothetical protein
MPQRSCFPRKRRRRSQPRVCPARARTPQRPPRHPPSPRRHPLHGSWCLVRSRSRNPRRSPRRSQSSPAGHAGCLARHGLLLRSSHQSSRASRWHRRSQVPRQRPARRPARLCPRLHPCQACHRRCRRRAWAALFPGRWHRPAAASQATTTPCLMPRGACGGECRAATQSGCHTNSC